MLYFRKGDYWEQIFDSLIYAANNILIIFILVGITFLTNVKYLNLNFIFFKISCFLRVSCYFQSYKKNGVKKIPGGGGGGVDIFFLEKQIFLISRFMLFSTLKKLILKSAPSLTG